MHPTQSPQRAKNAKLAKSLRSLRSLRGIICWLKSTTEKLQFFIYLYSKKYNHPFLWKQFCQKVFP
jgi:hypothetical protein